MALSMKCNSEEMDNELSFFGRPYSYPIYISLWDMSGFLASNRNVKSGYAAISDDGVLLLTGEGLIGGAAHYEIPRLTISSLKVKKYAFYNSYKVEIKGKNEGKKYYYKLTVNGKMVGSSAGKFPEHEKNAAELINSEMFFNEDGSIHIEPDILQYSADMSYGIQEAGTISLTKQALLKDLLLKFCIDRNDFNRAQALIAYRDGLINLLSHKTGIPRYYLSGRRYNHSGRAVIVPEPSLRVDNVYLPAAMLIELLEGYDKIYTNMLPEALKDLDSTRKIFNDYYTHRNEARKLAKTFDDFLLCDDGELWCFMIRQPSLHRHSIQAFRIRCWEFPVIGLPPFVTLPICYTWFQR